MHTLTPGKYANHVSAPDLWRWCLNPIKLHPISSISTPQTVVLRLNSRGIPSEVPWNAFASTSDREEMEFPDPFTTPALPPSPGVTSNFIDPPMRAPATYPIAYVLFGLNTTGVMARIYTKGVVMRKLHLEDCKCYIYLKNRNLNVIICSYIGLGNSSSILRLTREFD